MLKPPTLPELTAPPPPIEPKIRDLALEKFRALVRGNGIKPESVTIAKTDAQTLTYEAQAFVRLTTHYTSKTLPGKIDKGEAIGTPQAFEAALKNMVLDAQKNAAKRKTIIDTVMRRPDKGYGAREQVLKLDSLARDFVSHEGCKICTQTGKMNCPRCGGEKQMVCQTCHARQNILCPACRGTGQIFKNGQSLTCTRCKGRNRVQCPACQGLGNVKCKGCNGAGAISCANCKASGFISHLAHVELIAHLHFDYNRQGLPRDLTKMIDAFSLRYVERKDLELEILTGDYQENEPPENVPIGYNVKVSYGDITFDIAKKKPVTCTLLGQNGELIKGPEFLDESTKRGQEDLAKAAKGEGSVGEHLRASARFRLLRECIMAAASPMSQRESLSRLMNKYPVGVSSETMLRLLVQAHEALQIVARKPRLQGLAIGIGGYGILTAVYYVFVRQLLLAQFFKLAINPVFAMGALDVFLLIIGVLAGVGGAWFFTGKVLKETLKGLASPMTIKNLRPKISWTLWVSLALSIIISGVFYMVFVK